MSRSQVMNAGVTEIFYDTHLTMIKNQSSLIKSVIIYTVFHKSEGMIFVTSERLETHSEVILPTLCGMLTFQVHWHFFLEEWPIDGSLAPLRYF